MNPSPLAGILQLVATPIGNMEDITLRAIRVLKECDLVAAEDTRRTGQLLTHFGISKPLVSCHSFNEARRSEQILHRLAEGQKVALVSDAGTPGISDPGERVVRAAIKAGFKVEPIPGACALVAAISISGLPTQEFHFIGFLPHKSGRRRKELERLSTQAGTLAIYESPYRIRKLLGEIAEVMPARQVVITRELTKKFEEHLRGTASELLLILTGSKERGEFVVLIGPQNEDAASPDDDSEGDEGQAAEVGDTGPR